MDIGFILVFFLVFLLSVLFMFRPKGLPPGPISIPIIGCISILKGFSKGKPYLVLAEAAKKYGNVMSFKIGRERFVVLAGYDAVHEALVKQPDVFSDRPDHLPLVKELVKDGAGIIFQRYNHHWKILRRFTLQNLRDFGVGKTTIEEKISTEVQAAARVLEETNGQPIQIAPLLQNIAGNVNYGIIFGQRYEYNDPEFEILRCLTADSVAGSGPTSLRNFFPIWLTDLLTAWISKADRDRIKVAKKIHAFFLDRIKEHEDTYDENNIRDFVDLYIQMTRHEKAKEGEETFSKGNMMRAIQDLFLAGTETTATTLDWAFLFMTEYPDVQRKCQKELEEVLGNKTVEYSDRRKLPYVEATLQEIQRMANIVPLSVVHCTSKDTELLGYRIPQGSLIVPLLYSVSYDENHWTNPETFDPGRFINEAGTLTKSDALIPFSAGPRMCPGEPLARMELFLVFTSLLQLFTFERGNASVKHSFEAKPFQNTNSPLNYELRAKRR